jgi:hypothetical protein
MGGLFGEGGDRSRSWLISFLALIQSAIYTKISIYLDTMTDRLKTMRQQVKEEMEHIPRGNLPQNELRQVYWGLRMNSLGKKAKEPETKEDVLKKSIENVRKEYRDFEFQYDAEYFGIESEPGPQERR